MKERERGEYAGHITLPRGPPRCLDFSCPLQQREPPLLAYPLRRSPPGSYDASEGYARRVTHASSCSLTLAPSACSRARASSPPILPISISISPIVSSDTLDADARYRVTSDIIVNIEEPTLGSLHVSAFSADLYNCVIQVRDFPRVGVTVSIGCALS